MSIRAQFRTWRKDWWSWPEVEAYWDSVLPDAPWTPAERRRYRRNHAVNRIKALRHLLCCDTECG